MYLDMYIHRLFAQKQTLHFQISVIILPEHIGFE